MIPVPRTVPHTVRGTVCGTGDPGLRASPYAYWVNARCDVEIDMTAADCRTWNSTTKPLNYGRLNACTRRLLAQQ